MGSQPKATQMRLGGACQSRHQARQMQPSQNGLSLLT